jgi:hypothetical protein
MTPSGRKLYYLLFAVLAVILGTFGIAFVFIFLPGVLPSNSERDQVNGQEHGKNT